MEDVSNADPPAVVPETSRQLTKLTVNLTNKSLGALISAAAREDLTRTDTVNRALQVYEFLTREVELGSRMAIKRPNGKIELVTLM